MAKNIKVNNVTYNGVNSISVPLSAGGGNALFVDTSDGTATASDIADGETAYVDGVKVTGTATGGGGGYTITRVPNIQDDDFFICPSTANAGDKVVYYVKAGSPFYELSSIKDASGNSLTQTTIFSARRTGGGIYYCNYFVMPSSNVTVNISEL